MILTEVGEIGVHVDGRDYVLRPSLYAMSRLGDPREIVGIYGDVMGEAVNDVGRRQQFSGALSVIFCCTDDDVCDVFGYWTDEGYVPGRVPPGHLLPLARCLLKHGVVGALPDPPRRADDEPTYTHEFDARGYVSLAMAHLSLTEREAWNLTMTGLMGALRAKFPPQESDAPGAKAPTKEQHEATMEWFERIEAKRRKSQGGH
ncbi:DUF6246 family protein [Achromobacter veterisilvae]|uniref:DUF6246 family protein n=1 Tax=Achromobacter veterisilvae TaxID=2069367 RepID=A0ABZ2SB73_9BURK